MQCNHLQLPFYQVLKEGDEKEMGDWQLKEIWEKVA